MKIIVIILSLIFLSGCATYNPYKDPVYQAYLAGEISYADYVAHHDRMVAQQQARQQAFIQGMQRTKDNYMKSQEETPNIFNRRRHGTIRRIGDTYYWDEY